MKDICFPLLSHFKLQIYCPTHPPKLLNWLVILYYLMQSSEQKQLIVGYCSYHNEDVDMNIFEYKGCWTCGYFTFKENGPLISAEDAADILGKSKKTVIRWIKAGKLDGKLFVKKRWGFSKGWRKYFVYTKSI